MKNRMNVNFDGIGVVNNKGASKYWGVTNHNYEHSHTDWRLQLNSANGKTQTFYFEGCNPSENVAGSIIARFYDARQDGIKNMSYVKACDGVWYRIDPISNKVRKLVSGKDIPTGMIKDLPKQFQTPRRETVTSDLFENLAPFKGSISKYEADIINQMVNGFSTGELSPAGVRLMTKVLSTIES